MYSSEYGEANYFVAYLKNDQQRANPEKTWIYQYPQTTIDILKHMPMRTWPYISWWSKRIYGEIIYRMCKKMYEYLDSHDISGHN